MKILADQLRLMLVIQLLYIRILQPHIMLELLVPAEHHYVKVLLLKQKMVH